MYEFDMHIGEKVQKMKINFGRIIEPYYSSGQNNKTKDGMIEKTYLDARRLIENKKLSDGSRVAIVIDDYTRPTPVKEIIPELIAIIESCGLTDITIIIAGGFHRKMTEKEVAAKVGDDIYKRFSQKIIQHDALDNNSLSYLGETSDNIPVYINSNVVNADLVIGIGTVEIHPWAGFAGGAKIICPGVAGKITINYTHAIPVLKKGAQIGVYHNNPFLLNILEAAEMAGLDFIINVVLNSSKEIVSIYADTPCECHKKCIKDYLSINSICYPERADVVITTANPKYQYWGQAAIAGYNAANVVKNGGTRIVMAECPEGFGDSQQEAVFYYESLRNKWDSLKTYWDTAKGEEFENSRNATAIYRHLEKLGQADLIMVSKGFPPMLKGLESMILVKTSEEAFKIAEDKYGVNASIIVYDMGAMALPKITKNRKEIL